MTLSFPFHRKLNTKAFNSFITVAGVLKKELGYIILGRSIAPGENCFSFSKVADASDV